MSLCRRVLSFEVEEEESLNEDDFDFCEYESVKRTRTQREVTSLDKNQTMSLPQPALENIFDRVTESDQLEKEKCQTTDIPFSSKRVFHRNISHDDMGFKKTFGAPALQR